MLRNKTNKILLDLTQHVIRCLLLVLCTLYVSPYLPRQSIACILIAGDTSTKSAFSSSDTRSRLNVSEQSETIDHSYMMTAAAGENGRRL